MNSFGLGLILSFVDNASAGMNTATANFNRMSTTANSMTSSVSASATEMAAIAFSMSAVGDTFVALGESVTSVFAGITEAIISTGGQMLNYRMQLTALYGSAEAGEAKMEEIKQYAMSSVFEIQSLIPAVTMMKAVGIEALDEITTSSGSATQRLLDYASDLAAMMPNMRNVYGTGVNAAMGAFKEYIAEGNAISLKRGAGLDITAILGEDKGATVEERTQQIADLIDKLNIVGYTAALAGTPMQRMSNMQDALFNSLAKIADSGVFEAYCVLLETLSDWVFALVEDEETFNAITGVLAETVTALLSPLQSMLDWIVANSDAIISWIRENPKLVKNILLTVAAVGAFLIVGGSLLKLLSSIALATSGLNVLKVLTKLFTKLAVAALPFIALAGIAYVAWEKNLGGIQDKLTWFFNNIGDIFTVLSDAWGDNTLSEDNFVKAKQLGILPFIEGILQLKYYWDYFITGFKQGFTSFIEGLGKALGAIGIDITELGAKHIDFLDRLTQPGAEEEWTKLGEALGVIIGLLSVMALITKIIMPIISVFVFFGKAIGWVWKALKGVWSVLKWIGAVGSAIIVFFKDLAAAISLMKQGYGFFQVLGVWFPKLGAFFSKAGAFFSKLGSTIVSVFSSVKSFLVANFATISGVILAVAGILLQVWGAVDSWINGMDWSNLAKQVAGIGLAIAGFALTLGSVGAAVASIVGGIVLTVTSIKDWLENGVDWDNFLGVMVGLAAIFGGISLIVGSWIPLAIGAVVAIVLAIVMWWDYIAAFFVKIGKAIANFFVGVWNAITSFFVNAYNRIKGVVESIVQAVKNAIKVILSNPVVQTIIKVMTSIYNVVVGVIKTIVTYIVGVAKVIWAVIKLIGTIIAGVAKVIWAVISGVGKAIWAFIKGFANFIATVAMGIWKVIKAVVNFIVTLVKTAVQIVVAIVKVVYQFFRMIFYAILAVGKIVITAIVNFFKWLWNLVKPILQAIGDFFKFIFDWVKTSVVKPFVDWVHFAFNWVKEKVTAILTAIGNFFSNIFNWINENVITPFREFIGMIFDWIYNKVTAVTAWFSTAFETAANWIKNVFQGVADFFTNIWNTITSVAKSFFDWIADKLGGLTQGLSSIGGFFSNIGEKASGFFGGIGDKLKSFVGLDTGGYVKTTGIAVLHPNEVVVNDDTTRRLQSFLSKYENDTVNGLVKPDAPQAVLNNIYPTVMESVPVTTVPAEEVSTVTNNSSFVSNTTQNIVQGEPTTVVEKTGDTHNDYSVTFAAGSVVIQLLNASDAELEKAAEKIMKIIARKQQLRAMAVRK